jgi:hypothetical protein
VDIVKAIILAAVKEEQFLPLTRNAVNSLSEIGDGMPVLVNQLTTAKTCGIFVEG